MSLQLWIPPKVVEYRCNLCGAEFVHKEAGIRHAVKCVEKQGDEIAETTEARESSALDGPLDKEMWEWGRKRAAQGKQGFKRGRAA
jgi:hypothetical protein